MHAQNINCKVLFIRDDSSGEEDMIKLICEDLELLELG
jgi:hypothetical protein